MTTGILNIKLTASLVLYNNRPEVFIEAIESYLRGSNGLLVVIDNSETENFHPIFKNNRIPYFQRFLKRVIAIIITRQTSHSTKRYVGLPDTGSEEAFRIRGL